MCQLERLFSLFLFLLRFKGKRKYSDFIGLRFGCNDLAGIKKTVKKLKLIRVLGVVNDAFIYSLQFALPCIVSFS